jgi:hypothetical protein
MGQHAPLQCAAADTVMRPLQLTNVGRNIARNNCDSDVWCGSNLPENRDEHCNMQQHTAATSGEMDDSKRHARPTKQLSFRLRSDSPCAVSVVTHSTGQQNRRHDCKIDHLS